MSRFELVGLYDCPWYAKAEKIAEEIVSQNPAIEIHKEMFDAMQWNEFVTKMNMRHGWSIQRSPCVYEVLVDREGKANLIGDINDFCEFAILYFDVVYDPSTTALKDMVIANQATYGRGHRGHQRGDAELFNIAIVNAPIQMVELMLPQLLSSFSMIPYGLLLQISIFDEYTPKRNLDGLVMEIMDLASPLLYKARVVTTLPMALYRCHLFLLMEDFSRTLMEDKRDWLNRIEYKTVRIMNSFNSKKTKISDCRILIGGEGPSCYIAEICRKMAPYSYCGPGKVISSGQHVVQRAKAELSKIGNIPPGCITRLHAYGWPGMTGCYVEVNDATVRGGNYSLRGPGLEIPLAEIATRSNYIFTQFSGDFLTLQKQRLAYLVKQPNRFMCMAESAISTVHTWLMCDPTVRLMGEGVFSVTPSAAELVTDGFQTSEACLPVLNVGVECGPNSDFPPSTFLVQPAINRNGRWQPLGKVSAKTSARIASEVSRLWDLRQKIIYRDLDIKNVFPDYDELAKGVAALGAATSPLHHGFEGNRLPNLGEIHGEDNSYYTEGEEGEPGYATDEVDTHSYELTSDEN
ncbi:unnamed protein product [Orchesella dallaii]|uniref:Malate dehydrogenase 1B n=1 Tax=Orchesella dallaii TaxID=48710 RepID=A0ABP1QTD0_9HEXA